jgi:hypothetical protein
VKFHKFSQCGMAQADMTIGITEGLYPDKKDVTVVRLEDQGCFGAYVRLRDIKGEWHNFGSVDGFELALCGSDERDAIINLMRTLIEQHEANKAGVEIERQVTDYTQDSPSPFYNGLSYEGMEEEPDSDVYERLLSQNACLPEDEE